MSDERPLFLLITGPEDDHWRTELEKTLASRGPLGLVQAESAIDRILEIDYAAIIVDAATVKDFPLLVSRIRAQVPEARVIVATASPKWNLAREAFQSGATDYIRRSLNREDLTASLEAALAKPVLPWPR